MTQEQIDEFLTRLEGPEGCNFHEKIPGDVNSITWKCAGGHNQDLSRAILEKMGIPQAESDAFLARCTELHGYCDCEILFNAAETLSPDWSDMN